MALLGFHSLPNELRLLLFALFFLKFFLPLFGSGHAVAVGSAGQAIGCRDW